MCAPREGECPGSVCGERQGEQCCLSPLPLLPIDRMVPEPLAAAALSQSAEMQFKLQAPGAAM